MPQGLHLCQTPSWDIKLNSLWDFFMFSGYLSSCCFFTFADFVFLPNYPLVPPHTTAPGTCPLGTGQSTGNNHTREPFHKTVVKTERNWESLAASAPCSTRYTYKHIQSWWNKQQHCRCCRVSHQRCHTHSAHVLWSVHSHRRDGHISRVVPCASYHHSPWCSAVELMWQEHGSSDVFVRGDGWTLVFILSAQVSGCLHHCHPWPLLHKEGAY